MRSLMTPMLVIEYTNVKKVGFSPCTFSQLHQIEYSEARTCLGFALWEEMVGSMADYSNVQSYQAGAYSTGALVEYKGVIYRARVDTSNMPTLLQDWEIAPIFTGDCTGSYDALFCSFLAPYLAHRILARRLPYLRNVIKDHGVLEYSGENYDTTDEAQWKSLQHAINRDAAECWNNLLHHMSRKTQSDLADTCYKGWIPYEKINDCDATGNCSDDRIRTGRWKFA